jgi:hypothetical protein
VGRPSRLQAPKLPHMPRVHQPTATLPVVLSGAYGASSAARLGAAAVMAGLDPAIHSAPPRMSPGSAANGARASGTKRFDLAAPLRSFSAPKHVDGRDEPAMTLQVRFAPPQYSEFPGCQQLACESRALSCQITESVLCISLRRTEARRPEASRSHMEQKDAIGLII